MPRTVALFILLASLSSEALAQPSTHLGFDWRKHPTPGDITVPISQNQRDKVFHVGPGRIELTASITLLQAVLDADSLTLKFTVHDPQQTVKFEDLQGASGSYKPAGWKARRIAISKSPHTEQFIRKGVLTLTVRKAETPQNNGAGPANAPLSSLLPGPESGYKPRDEVFARFAAAVSGKYKMPGRNTHRDYKVQWQEAAQTGVKYPSPTIQKVAQAMLEGAQEVREINVAAVRANLLREAQQIEGRIASGEYTRREGYRENGIVASRTVDESGAARSRAQYLRSVAAKNDTELKKWQAGQLQTTGWADLFSDRTVSRNPDVQFQHLVNEAQKILPLEAAKHAGPKSNSSLVDMTRPDSSLVKIRNASRQRLTDVILNLGVGFTRSVKKKSYGAPILLFVPVWNPDDQLELEFGLKDPQVIHFVAGIYANEASSEDHTFSLLDPHNPPNNKPGTIILHEKRGFASFGKPRFVGTAWAEVDGKRVDWKDTENPLEITVEPGEHKIIVHAKEKSGRPGIVYEGSLLLDGEERRSIEVAFPQMQLAVRALQLARQALAQKNKLLAVRYLKEAVAAAPDSPAGRSAQKILQQIGN